MSIRFALFVGSLLLTAVVAGVILKSTDEPWRRYQAEYYDLALGRASSEAVKEAIRSSGLEIKQDMLTGFGERSRTDRCRTCHMAMDDPGFKAGEHPLRTHPEIPSHPFSEFGCTICHEGQGRALSAFQAHGEDHYWPEPILPKPYIESSCARCHPEPYLDATPHLRRGRKLFEKYACVGCHTVRGVSRGTLGPDHTDLGNRRRIEALTESIEDPAANSPLTRMPAFKMPPEDRVDLVVFLKSRRGRSLVEDPVTLRTKTRAWRASRPPELPEVTSEAGRAAIDRRGCTACHKLGEEDGELAPDLSILDRVREADYVVEHLVDPRRHTPDSNMPNFWMSDSEKQAIAEHLTSPRGFVAPASPSEQYAALCSRCHGETGGGDGAVAGNLIPRPREFTNAKFFNWLPEERAHLAIREGVPGTAMPPFRKVLTEEQARGLFDWVRSEFLRSERKAPKRPRVVPGRNPTPYTPESVARGEEAFLARCIGCHGRLGDGRGPSAPGMSPRPRNLTGKRFFEPVADPRIFESITYGIVGTGMPPWDYLSDSLRWDLVNFVRSLSMAGPTAGGDDR